MERKDKRRVAIMEACCEQGQKVWLIRIVDIESKARRRVIILNKTKRKKTALFVCTEDARALAVSLGYENALL